MQAHTATFSEFVENFHCTWGIWVMIRFEISRKQTPHRFVIYTKLKFYLGWRVKWYVYYSWGHLLFWFSIMLMFIHSNWMYMLSKWRLTKFIYIKLPDKIVSVRREISFFPQNIVRVEVRHQSLKRWLGPN